MIKHLYKTLAMYMHIYIINTDMHVFIIRDYYVSGEQPNLIEKQSNRRVYVYHYTGCVSVCVCVQVCECR